MSVTMKCSGKAAVYQVLLETDILSSYVWFGCVIYLKHVHNVFAISLSGCT